MRRPAPARAPRAGRAVRRMPRAAAPPNPGASTAAPSSGSSPASSLRGMTGAVPSPPAAAAASSPADADSAPPATPVAPPPASPAGSAPVAEYWSDLLNTPDPDTLGPRARSASDAGVLRRKGHLKEQDALIEFMRDMHSTHTAPEVMAKFDMWIEEHRRASVFFGGGRGAG